MPSSMLINVRYSCSSAVLIINVWADAPVDAHGVPRRGEGDLGPAYELNKSHLPVVANRKMNSYDLKVAVR